MSNRKELLRDLQNIISFIQDSSKYRIISKIYLLGSLITAKLNPNDIDLMFIIDYDIIKSVLRFQQDLRLELLDLVDSEMSINFGESIDSIYFLDGEPLEAYLQVFDKRYVINLNKWFTSNGEFNSELAFCLGYTDCESIRFTKGFDVLSIQSQEGNQTAIQIEKNELPKKAIWNFLHKRCNAKIPELDWEMDHPKSWNSCQRCGRCCEDFQQIKTRLIPEIPLLFDIISNEQKGVIWKTIEINSEADLYWVVEKGLSSKQIEQILERNRDFKIIPCPFLQLNTSNSDPKSACMIWDRKPDACSRFPEYQYEIDLYDCNNA